MPVEWTKIKNEYINDPTISLRKLAAKHGVNKDTVAIKARKENWKDIRDRQTDSIQTKAIQKAAEKASDALADEVAMKVQIRAGLFRLAADWISKQEVIEDTAEYRRMVQSCVDLGILEAKEAEEMKKGGIVLIPQVGGDAQ